MIKQTIRIEGMHCNGCVRSVTNALKHVEGVRDVEVSLTEEQAIITFDKNAADLDSLQKALEDIGYHIPSPAQVA